MVNTPDLMELMAGLIRTPSVSSVSPEFDQSNMALIELLASWLEDLHFNVEILPLPMQPNKANLLASMGSGPGGLVLSGHTDTVPYDAGLWNFDPFKLTEKDQRLYGLGTSDMKGFFALAIEAARRFDPKQFKHPLFILATADEESSMEGAKMLVDLGRPKARHAVIGEPTGMRPVHRHKGIIMEAIHVHGHGGHSSNPSLGVNAIEGLHRAIDMLLNWREELQGAHQNKEFNVPFPTLNLGLVSGGDNPNRICSHAQVHFDLRILPSMDMALVHEELDKRLETVFKETSYRFERRQLSPGTPAMDTDVNAPIVKAIEKLTGYASEAVAFCTEAPYLNSLGMQTVVMGPGDIAQAHQPDEFLSLDRLQPTVDLLEKLIYEFCVQ
ncbi:MAG: acetylornithine deacetylase [Gammaproteobacteria bacterium]|nr:acetylornithine deacetylase [Gammaproteobacteria bacterium]MDH5693526.1 acetylornithine deacetylase [Gammaproteobacteria bacterium]